MEARAMARHVRISPRKVRQVVDTIRGKGVDEALALLKFTPKSSALPIEKVLRSAVANAENNHDLNRDELAVQEAYVDQGPSMKRMRPRARGSANIIKKRTSHITVVVAEKEGS